MKFNLITIFPNVFPPYFEEGMIGRALKNNLIEIKTHDLRDWTTDRHRSVDDTPYGGGAGMVMKVEPIYKALNSPLIRPVQSPAEGGVGGLGDSKTESEENNPSVSSPRPELGTKAGREKIRKQENKSKIILLSAKGKTWNQQMAREYSTLENITFICGRYEGVDERVKEFIDEEISIGDYVLTGGELGAMVIIDSIARLLPGVLGNEESAISESHSEPGVLEYPQYTRPEVFTADGKEHKVPDVLLSGNHAEIEKWRKKQMIKM